MWSCSTQSWGWLWGRRWGNLRQGESILLILSCDRHLNGATKICTPKELGQIQVARCPGEGVGSNLSAGSWYHHRSWAQPTPRNVLAHQTPEPTKTGHCIRTCMLAPQEPTLVSGGQSMNIQWVTTFHGVANLPHGLPRKCHPSKNSKQDMGNWSLGPEFLQPYGPMVLCLAPDFEFFYAFLLFLSM